MPVKEFPHYIFIFTVNLHSEMTRHLYRKLTLDNQQNTLN